MKIISKLMKDIKKKLINLPRL